MYNYSRSWIFWIIVILIIIAIIVFFAAGSGCPSHYRISSFENDDSPAGVVINKISSVFTNDVKEEKLETEEEKEREETEDEEENKDPIDLTPIIPECFVQSSNGIIEESLRTAFDPSGVKRTKPERICRRVLEKIYGKKFSRVHPEWLRNPLTNRKLELDCYNDELKIALEYNGYQHYVWPNHYPMSKSKFLKQLQRDEFKIDRCDERGVYLITVPYNVDDRLIPDFIRYYLPENYRCREEIISEISERIEDGSIADSAYSECLD